MSLLTCGLIWVPIPPNNSPLARNRRSSNPASGRHTPGFRTSRRKFFFCNTLARGKCGRHWTFPQTAGGGGYTNCRVPWHGGKIQCAQQLVGSFSRENCTLNQCGPGLAGESFHCPAGGYANVTLRLDT